MSSSIPAALDYLVVGIRDLDLVTQPETGPRVVVADGWPTQRGDALIAIGVTPEEDDAAIAVSYAELSQMEHEIVELPSIIFVRRVGDNATSAARASAFALLDAINTLVRDDRKLGGAIKPGLPARLAGYTLSQTAEPKQAGEGRIAEIRFVLAWKHRG